MGLFDWFRRKKPSASPDQPAPGEEPKSVEASPEEPLPEEPAPEHHALIESTRVSYAEVAIGDGDERDPRASKLGGIPYRPVKGPYDELLARDELTFIAQVRCDALPALPAFPRYGLLQFWIAHDDLSDGVGERSDGRVCLYYLTTDAPQLEGWRPTAGADSPLTDPGRGRPLTFTARTEIMTPGDYQWRATRDRLGITAPPDLGQSDYEPTGHRVGGYCAFTQGDPRNPNDPQLSLLQLDSSAEVEWGDSGIAHWFLREADLRALAFENTLFYWDCC